MSSLSFPTLMDITAYTLAVSAQSLTPRQFDSQDAPQRASDHFKLLSKLYNQGVKKNIISGPSQIENIRRIFESPEILNNAMIQAVIEGDIISAKILVPFCDLDTKLIVLKLASFYGYLELIQLITKNCCTKNASSIRSTFHVAFNEALCIAASNRHLDIVKYLVENNIANNLSKALYNIINQTPFLSDIGCFLTENGNVTRQKPYLENLEEIVRYLVEKGASIAAKQNALKWSSIYNLPAIVEYLSSQLDDKSKNEALDQARDHIQSLVNPTK